MCCSDSHEFVRASAECFVFKEHGVDCTLHSVGETDAAYRSRKSVMDQRPHAVRVKHRRVGSRGQGASSQATSQPLNVTGQVDDDRSEKARTSDANDEYDKEYVEKLVKERMQTIEAERHRNDQERKKLEEETRAEAKRALDVQEELKNRDLEKERVAQEEMKQKIRKEIDEEDRKRAKEAEELDKIKRAAVEQWKKDVQAEEEERKAKLDTLIGEAGLEQILEQHQLSQSQREEIAAELTARIGAGPTLQKSQPTSKRFSLGTQDRGTAVEETNTMLAVPKSKSSVRSFVSSRFKWGHGKAPSIGDSLKSGVQQSTGERRYSMSLSKPARFVCALADGQNVSLLNTMDSLVRPTNPHDESLIEQLLETQSTVGEAFASLQERYQSTIREYIQSDSWRKSPDERLDILQIKSLYDERRSGFLGRSCSKVCTGVFFVFTVMSENIPSMHTDDRSDDEMSLFNASTPEPPRMPTPPAGAQSNEDAPKQPMAPVGVFGQKLDPKKWAQSEQSRLQDTTSESGMSHELPPSMDATEKKSPRRSKSNVKKKLRFRSHSRARSGDSQSEYVQT